MYSNQYSLVCHDNSYIDGWLQIIVNTEERTQNHSAKSSLVVTHPSRLLTDVDVPLLQ